MNLFNLLNRQRRWSRETFGDGQRTEGILRHIEKELDEVRSKPNDLREWADIVILALDGALRRGFTPFDICRALEKKQAENMARVWNVGPEDEPVEHVRDATDGWEYDLSKAWPGYKYTVALHYGQPSPLGVYRNAWVERTDVVDDDGLCDDAWYRTDCDGKRVPIHGFVYAFRKEPLLEPPPLPGEDVKE